MKLNSQATHTSSGQLGSVASHLMHRPEKTVSFVCGIENQSTVNLTVNEFSASSRTNEFQSSKVEKGGLLPCKLPMGSKQFRCSTHGCQLAFNNMQQLLQHSRVHSKPIQSLAGKQFHCSTLGCKEVLPSMQELLTHQKTHYKPNRYFKCENCMLRFRSHRSLFKHLHVCYNVSTRPSTPRIERIKPDSGGGLEASVKPLLLEGLPKIQSVIIHPEKKAVLPSSYAVTTTPSTIVTSLHPANSLDDELPGIQNDNPELESKLSLSPVTSPVPQTFSPLETSLYGSSTLPQLSGEAHSPTSEHFIPYGQPSPHNSFQTDLQHNLKQYLPSQSLPVSNAVWKKNQDCSEHLNSFHSKLTPDLENPVYSQT
ncbi:zinc finger protein 414 isoform X2 [Lissotriton helveticus]